MESTMIILAILVVAVLGRADSVGIASCALLICKLLRIDRYVFPVIAGSGTFWGLVLLIAAILIPIADGSVAPAHVKKSSRPGSAVLPHSSPFLPLT